MAGDPVYDAIRDKLTAILALLAITSPTWSVKDTDAENPDASAAYIQIRFEGGFEKIFARGGTGTNLWKEEGQVFIDFLVPLGFTNGRELQETYSRAVREGLRGAMFNCSKGRVEIETVGTLGGPQVGSTGMNERTVGISYRIYNVG